MKADRRILACVDQSRYADHVADHAAWAAARMRLPLEFLHVLDRHPERAIGDDHSGAIGIDAQQHLLSELSSRDEAASRAARERGRIFLNALRERAVAAGVHDADVRQRHGSVEDTLVEQQIGVELFVLGRRGKSADATHRDLGRHVERVIRALNRPILTVTENFREPKLALLAFDGGLAARRGAAMIASNPLFTGMAIHLLMSGRVGRDAPKQLETARVNLAAAGFEVSAEQTPGDPELAIAAAIDMHHVDLLVMGAYSHSAWRALLFGSRTSELLRASKIPTLLLR